MRQFECCPRTRRWHLPSEMAYSRSAIAHRMPSWLRARRSAADRGTFTQATAVSLPNDANYYQQTWSANMLDLPQAWAITTGSAAVTVAVVDMGVRFDHPEHGANLTNDGYDFVSHVRAADRRKRSATEAAIFTSIDGDGDGPDADPTDPDDHRVRRHRRLLVPQYARRPRPVDGGNHRRVGNERHRHRRCELDREDSPDPRARHHGRRFVLRHRAGRALRRGLAGDRRRAAQSCRRPRSPIINMSLGGDGAITTCCRTPSPRRSSAGSLIVASAGNDGLRHSQLSRGVSRRDGRRRGRHGRRSSRRTRMRARTSRFRRRAAISVSTTTAAAACSDRAGTFAQPRRRTLRLRHVGVGAVRVGHRRASARAEAVAHRRAAALAHRDSSRRAPADCRAATRYGWGIVNAYNALTQQNGPPRSTIAASRRRDDGRVGGERAGRRERQLRVHEASRTAHTTAGGRRRAAATA